MTHTKPSRLLAPLLCCIVLLCSALAGADQTDPRLDTLFERLKNAEDLGTATLIEQRIWSIWMEAPNNEADELMQSGVEAMQRSRLDVALRRFSELIELTPEFAEAWNKRATVHYMLGNYTQSMRDIERTLELAPRHFGALSGLGSIFARLNQPAAAIRVFERVLEINPNSPGIEENIRIMEQRIKGRRT